MSKLTDRFRAVAFDLDGTLIDTMPDLAVATNRMLSTLGTAELPDPRVRALIGHGVERLVLNALTESLGRPPAHAAEGSAALTLFRRLYGNALFEQGKVYPGVVPALQALAAAGIPLCCITNKDSVFSVPLLQQAGLTGWLKFTLCADRIEDRKPAPAMLLAACSRFGISPAEMLYVGDSSIDIAAARAAGCPVVAVTYGYAKELANAPDKPDGFVDNMTELLTLNLRAPSEPSHRDLPFTRAP